jgi:hypothetical protein
MLKKIKGLTMRQPKFSNVYVKTISGQHSKKYPGDFVETFIEEKKKQLMKEKNV